MKLTRTGIRMKLWSRTAAALAITCSCKCDDITILIFTLQSTDSHASMLRLSGASR